MIAYCGLDCAQCQAYLATQNNDDEMRVTLAQKWSSPQWTLKPEDIVCYGCNTPGKASLAFCAFCEVRKCAISRQLNNCACCDDYGCEKLAQHWAHLEGGASKTNLDRIRAAR